MNDYNSFDNYETNVFNDEEQQKQQRSSETDSFSFESLGFSCPGTRIVSSTKPTNYDVEKFRLKKQSVARISFINEEFLQISTHWNQSTGSFFCTGGYCCSKLGRSTPKKYGLIINYKNIDSRGMIVGNKLDYTIEMIQLGNKNYETLDAARGAADVSNRNSGYDLIVRCLDEKFQNFSFNVITQKAAWLRSEEVKKDVFAKLKKYGNGITQCIGKILTEEKIKEMLDRPIPPAFGGEPIKPGEQVNQFHSGLQQQGGQGQGGNLTSPEEINETNDLFI